MGAIKQSLDFWIEGKQAYIEYNYIKTSKRELSYGFHCVAYINSEESIMKPAVSLCQSFFCPIIEKIKERKERGIGSLIDIDFFE